MPHFGRKKIHASQIEKRKAERSSAGVVADVQTPASREPVTIVDISASGARLKSSNYPPSRQDVQLNVNGLAVFGSIVWRRDNLFGLRFDQALNEYSPEEIQEAVKTAEAERDPFDREAALQSLLNQPTKSDDQEGETGKAADDAVATDEASKPTRSTRRRTRKRKVASKSD